MDLSKLSFQQFYVQLLNNKGIKITEEDRLDARYYRFNDFWDDDDPSYPIGRTEGHQVVLSCYALWCSASIYFDDIGDFEQLDDYNLWKKWERQSGMSLGLYLATSIAFQRNKYMLYNTIKSDERFKNFQSIILDDIAMLYKVVVTQLENHNVHHIIIEEFKELSLSGYEWILPFVDAASNGLKV